jgi:predicted O-methyltransferase YrrM
MNSFGISPKAKAVMRALRFDRRRASMRVVDFLVSFLSRLVPARIMRHCCWLLSRNPDIPDRWGFHIRPIHFYDPLPDFQALTPLMLEQRRAPPEIDFALPSQTALLATLASESRAELHDIARKRTFDFSNFYFTGLDACAYYALIRHLKPRKVIEIGAGYSTRMACLAIAHNEADGQPAELTCIEPYPEPRLTESHGKFELVIKKLEDVPLAAFEVLAPGDILLIDSSHVAKIHSDVCYAFLDILPRLRPGVWVHVHDIFFPRDYPAKWIIGERRAYNEQYILEALLSGNKSFIPKLANHWLVLDYPEAVTSLCPPLAMRGVAIEQLGSSFWMCRR